MAKEGARFDKFYITSPMCTPSRGSILTGQYATRSKTALKKCPAELPDVCDVGHVFHPGGAFHSPRAKQTWLYDRLCR